MLGMVTDLWIPFQKMPWLAKTCFNYAKRYYNVGLKTWITVISLIVLMTVCLKGDVEDCGKANFACTRIGDEEEPLKPSATLMRRRTLPSALPVCTKPNTPKFHCFIGKCMCCCLFRMVLIAHLATLFVHHCSFFWKQINKSPFKRIETINHIEQSSDSEVGVSAQEIRLYRAQCGSREFQDEEFCPDPSECPGISNKYRRDSRTLNLFEKKAYAKMWMKFVVTGAEMITVSVVLCFLFGVNIIGSGHEASLGEDVKYAMVLMFPLNSFDSTGFDESFSHRVCHWFGHSTYITVLLLFGVIWCLNVLVIVAKIADFGCPQSRFLKMRFSLRHHWNQFDDREKNLLWCMSKDLNYRDWLIFCSIPPDEFRSFMLARAPRSYHRLLK